MEYKLCMSCMKLKQQKKCEHCGWDESLDHLSNAPRKVGDYILGRVKTGYYHGVTIAAWDMKNNCPVRVKEGNPAWYPAWERISQLRCFSVPRILALSRGETACAVMEWVEGISLSDYIKQRGGRLSAAETSRLITPLIQDMCQAHKMGLLHQHIVPGTIVLTEEGYGRFKDFGALTMPVPGPNGYNPYKYNPHSAETRERDIYGMCKTIYACLMGMDSMSQLDRRTAPGPLNWNGCDPQTRRELKALIEQVLNAPPGTRFPPMETLYGLIR